MIFGYPNLLCETDCEIIQSKIVLERDIHIPNIIARQILLLGQFDPLALKIHPAKLNHGKELREFRDAHLSQVHGGALNLLTADGLEDARA